METVARAGSAGGRNNKWLRAGGSAAAGVAGAGRRTGALADKMPNQAPTNHATRRRTVLAGPPTHSQTRGIAAVVGSRHDDTAARVVLLAPRKKIPFSTMRRRKQQGQQGQQGAGTDAVRDASTAGAAGSNSVNADGPSGGSGGNSSGFKVVDRSTAKPGFFRACLRYLFAFGTAAVLGLISTPSSVAGCFVARDVTDWSVVVLCCTVARRAPPGGRWDRVAAAAAAAAAVAAPA